MALPQMKSPKYNLEAQGSNLLHQGALVLHAIKKNEQSKLRLTSHPNNYFLHKDSALDEVWYHY